MSGSSRIDVRHGPLRIAISVPAFLEAPDFGGPVTKVSLLAQGLAARGHDVTVLTADYGVGRSRVPAGPRDEGSYRSMYFPTIFRYRWSPVIWPLTFRRVRWDFDIVHVCAIRDGLSVGLSMRSALHGTPYVVEPMGMGVARLRNTRLKKVFDKALTQFQLARARLVITTSNREKRDLLRVYSLPEVRVRSNPVLMEPIHPQRKKPPKVGERYEILFVGRICRTKNLDQLLLAVADLDHVHVTIAGPDDRDGTRVQIDRIAAKLGPDRVTLIDWVDAAQRDELIDQADICILPSLTENFGNFAVEAARGRRPVIVTTQTGVAELLEGSAAIVEPTAAELRGAIVGLIENEALRNKYADDGMALVNAFEVSVVAELQEQIYFDALEKASVKKPRRRPR